MTYGHLCCFERDVFPLRGDFFPFGPLVGFSGHSPTTAKLWQRLGLSICTTSGFNSTFSDFVRAMPRVSNSAILALMVFGSLSKDAANRF